MKGWTTEYGRGWRGEGDCWTKLAVVKVDGWRDEEGCYIKLLGKIGKSIY